MAKAKMFGLLGTKTILVPAAVAALTAAVMAGVPALAQSSAPEAAPAAAATPIIKVGFKNGPVSFTGSGKTVASMSLGKGSWDIFAKAWLHGGPSPVVVTCVLVAGADFDGTTAALEVGPTSAFAQAIALNVAHKFRAAGSVKLQCTSIGTTVSANFIKISAINAGTLTSVKLP
jgi:hypothetical protein